MAFFSFITVIISKFAQPLMYLFGKHISKLESLDILRLIENKIRENTTLEYKRELNLDEGKDKGRQEFLFDVSAMYNTDGGCIIYGIEEARDNRNKNTGYPAKLHPLEIDNIDALSLKIRDIVRSGTQPAIANVEVAALSVEGSTVIIIGISKGFGLPVMVTYNDLNKFYRRNTSGKYAVDVFELNQLFQHSQSLIEAAERSKIERVERVMAGEIYLALDIRNALFVNIVPAGRPQDNLVDLERLSLEAVKEAVLPVRINFEYNKIANGTGTAFNYDGFLCYRTSGTEEKIFAYTQFFRNGGIEFFSNEYFVDRANNNISEDYLFGTQMIWAIIQCIHNTRIVWTHLELNPPFLAFISLRVPPTSLSGVANRFQGKLSRYRFDLPYIYFAQFPTTNGEIYDQIKRHLDIIWQTAGQPTAPSNSQFFNTRN
jgi:hypothetical protein